jgi:beta-carotene/zeaxanthin 4-ketolase
MASFSESAACRHFSGSGSWIGVGWAIALFLAWVASLLELLYLPIDQLSWLLILVVIVGRTVLQTGLFIVAHDAMHRSLLPQHPWLNHAIGRVAVGLYAFLSYQHCRQQHRNHHRSPAQIGDPDFHDGVHCHPVAWYFKFMVEYLSGYRLVQLVLSWIGVLGILVYGLQVSPTNAIAFWVAPLVLSSLQLFIFGTYLPHRHSVSRDFNRHRAVSSGYPVWLSFLTCYHLGYHWEHHEYPHLPWYDLPAARQVGSKMTKMLPSD